ncbi:Cof-type HAD-IIB family hydrolase [Anoxynatronum sibiricum]|uniref:Cof-type HAD-IIB family hydrolase n=1 Tax=Anoxynatronum sibiricum TaxID=210623 RepID=A0ABU9VXP9_9CLOT
MKNTHIKLIVSDVDGTLFESGNQVNSTTVKMVHDYQRSGGIFTLATGRLKKAIEPFIQQLHIRFPVIVYNGAQIVDSVTGEVLAAHTLDRELALKALDLLAHFPLDTIMHVNQVPYVRSHTPAVLEHMEKDGIACRCQENLTPLADKDPTKMLIIGDPFELKQFASELIVSAGYDFGPVYSDWNYLEILPAGASKGAALEQLVKLKGFAMEEVVAVGDERNDLSMIRAAGTGVAVANANEELKAAANRITQGPWNLGLEEILEEAIQSLKENDAG